MPGYSGTPLPKKLGIKPGHRVYLFNDPPEVRNALRSALSRCEVTKEAVGPLDFVMLFSTRQDEMRREFERAAILLTDTGMVWASWPKKSSGVSTDLTEGWVRQNGLDSGLVDVKVCAVTGTWSGLKFVTRVTERYHPRILFDSLGVVRENVLGKLASRPAQVNPA